MQAVVHVDIQASVIKPETLMSFETNTFAFIFVVDRRKDADGKLVPFTHVLPTTGEYSKKYYRY